MSDTVLIALVSAASVVITAAIGLAVAWVDRRSKHRTAEAASVAAAASDRAAEAAEKAAEAAADEARAQMLKAVVAAREQASADWARFLDAKDREIEGLRERVEENDRRLGQAEMRALADRERADRFDRLYWKAVVYLRIVIRWINDEHPGENYPAPPAELVDDL